MVCDGGGTLCAWGLCWAKPVWDIRRLHERLCGDAPAEGYSKGGADQRGAICREGAGHHRSLSWRKEGRESESRALAGLAELLGCRRCHLPRPCAAVGQCQGDWPQCTRDQRHTL